jgi:hypothetical protein
MQRVGLVTIMLALAAILALPACSNRKGSALDPAPAASEAGGNGMGGNSMGGNGGNGGGY